MSEGSKTINELALEYMEEKYGEAFTYDGPYGDSMSGTHKLFARCESLPDRVYIEIENYRKEDRVFRDNYIAVKYKQEMKNYLTDQAVAVFGNAAVYYEVINEALPESLPADVSFQDYLAGSGVSVGMSVEVRERDYSDPSQVQALAESIADSGLRFYMTFVVSTDNRYGAASRAALSERVRTEDFSICVQVAALGDGIQYRWHEKG